MYKGEVIQFKYNNVVLVRLEDDREIEVAIDKSVFRKLHKVSSGDRFTIKISDPPRLSHACALIKMASQN